MVKVDDVIDARRKARWTKFTDKGLLKKVKKLEKQFIARRKTLEAKRDKAEGKLREKKEALEKEVEEAEDG